MQRQNSKSEAAYIAELTFQLLKNCQEKEARYAREQEISVPQFRCLRHLYQSPRATVKQLAENMNLTSSRITRIVDKLLEQNLVIRQEGAADRRIFIVDLTYQGKVVAEKLYEGYNKLHEEIFSTIPASKHATIARSLEKLLTAVDVWLKT